MREGEEVEIEREEGKRIEENVRVKRKTRGD